MTSRIPDQRQAAGLTITEWAGTGLTVFGLPGLGNSATAWGPLAQALPDVRIVSVDLRGRGSGQALIGPTGLRAHAEDVARIFDALDLRDVVVIGHSMGAFLALLVAQQAPDRVKKLVLVDGGIRPSFPFFMGPLLTRLAFRRQLHAMDKDWPSIEAVAKKGKLDKMLASRPDLRPIVLTMLEDEMGGRPGALRPRVDTDRCAEDAVDTFWGPDALAALESLQVPTEMFLAENMKWEGQRPFISDAAVAPWLAKLPMLTVHRLKGNHITVVFAPEVAQAVSS